MSVSQPSKETVFIDIPKVKNFQAKFQYNFFVADEAVESSITGIPNNVLQRQTDQFDTSFIDQIKSRVPRFVRFDFTPVTIQSYTKETNDATIRDNNIRSRKVEKNYIKNNLSKIIDEDYFTIDDFTTVNLNDQSITNKLFQLISGTAMILIEDRAQADAQSGKQLAKETDKMSSDQVTFQFLSKYLVQPNEDNTFFFEKNANKLYGDAASRLKEVDIHVQVNNKFFNDIVNTSIVNSYSTFNSDFTSLYAISKAIQQNAKSRTLSDMMNDDYKSVISQVSYVPFNSNTSTTQTESKVVGYMIEKSEILPNGKSIQHDSIILENPFISTAIDYDVKYYSTYEYNVRTITELTIPTIIEDTRELVIAKVLLKSNPTYKVQVKCVDFRVPSTPTDFNFHFNFEIKKLVLTWTYPPTQERDVKKFQVFRRQNINEPFQLMQVYDFDDSQVKAISGEKFLPELVIKNMSPTLMWIDPDFNRDSSFIYALASIDAHGLTSNYSEQIMITFDKFKNKIIKKRISSSGAPKPYPNMYLNSDTFVDLMRDNGHKSMTIAFVPEHLAIYNNQQQDLKFLTTTKDSGKYKISIINTDIQIEKTVDITLEDRRLHKEINDKFSKRL